MKKWQKFAGGALAFTLLIGVTGQAAAGPVVNTWSYEINNGFSSFEPVPGVVGLDPNAALGTPTRLEWPLSGSDRSSLLVDSTQSGFDLATNGANVAGATLTHNNLPIATRFSNEFLRSGRLSVQIDLASADPNVGESITLDTFFDFAFLETENTGPCGFGSSSTCDDIFVLTGSGDLSQDFTYDGHTYTLVFGSEQLSTLDPAACQQLGLGASCVGFLTPENASTDFRTFVQIIGPSSVPVPEPGILALIGTGLIILGAVQRRRVV